jgi:hypothetical protein
LLQGPLLAACSRLQRLSLELLGSGAFGAASSFASSSLAALTSLRDLTVPAGYGDMAAEPPPDQPANVLAAGAVYRQLVAAAAELPLLQALDLYQASLPLDSTKWLAVARVAQAFSGGIVGKCPTVNGEAGWFTPPPSSRLWTERAQSRCVPPEADPYLGRQSRGSAAARSRTAQDQTLSFNSSPATTPATSSLPSALQLCGIPPARGPLPSCTIIQSPIDPSPPC